MAIAPASDDVETLNSGRVNRQAGWQLILEELYGSNMLESSQGIPASTRNPAAWDVNLVPWLDMYVLHTARQVEQVQYLVLRL